MRRWWGEAPTCKQSLHVRRTCKRSGPFLNMCRLRHPRAANSHGRGESPRPGSLRRPRWSRSCLRGHPRGAESRCGSIPKGPAPTRRPRSTRRPPCRTQGRCCGVWVAAARLYPCGIESPTTFPQDRMAHRAAALRSLRYPRREASAASRRRSETPPAHRLRRPRRPIVDIQARCPPAEVGGLRGCRTR